jgi:hypothetical protein
MEEEFEEFDLDEEFDGEEDDDFIEDFDREMLASLVETASATALKLTELVVDNNHRNNVKMEAEDIYGIHAQAFASAFNTIVQGEK